MFLDKDNIVLLLFCIDYSALLFFLGFTGVLINRRNILLMLLSLELTFLASALNFIFADALLNLWLGSIYSVFIVLVVVADTSIGLSLVVLVHRGSKVASVNSLITLRG